MGSERNHRHGLVCFATSRTSKFMDIFIVTYTATNSFEIYFELFFLISQRGAGFTTLGPHFRAI